MPEAGLTKIPKAFSKDIALNSKDNVKKYFQKYQISL